ncbi:MAG: hypothetical protein CVU00_14600 [Bacteroidetes bacterium HGW-Bacteroidetes-17]|jgi:peroxiredoxin|nr:MAG: hypothetical protein CVU00_14600 [Bacteroidetes bacterium HGW-Bacteroidetes-17]
MKNFLLKYFFFGFLLFFISGVNAQSFNRRVSDPRLDSLRNEKDSIRLEEKLLQLSNSNKEEDLILAVKFYNATQQIGKAEILVDVAKKKFPKGLYSYVAAKNKVIMEKDPIKKEIYFKEVFHDFPEKTATDDLDMYWMDIASGYAEAGNKDKAIELISIVKADVHPDYLYIIAEKLYQKEYWDASLKFITDAINIVEKTKASKNEKAVTEGDPLNVRNNAQYYYYIFINLYSKVLAKTGKIKEAFQYAKEAYDYDKKNEKENDEIVGNYTSLLVATGSYSEALPILERYVKEGKGTNEMKNDLKTVYTKLNGDRGYQDYYNSLTSDLKKKINEDLVKLMINEKAPDFVLTDLKGKQVSLKDCKGKIVVIDFWATWCSPCKKSLPAMQKAVNKYKNDPNVKFLFVHTWEKANNPIEDVRNFIKENKYTFDVYMDLKDPVTKSNKVVSSFKVSGIPTKFIIDKNGNIRFKVVGNSGGDDTIFEEIISMIEIAKSR